MRKRRCGRCKFFESYGVDGQVFEDKDNGLTYDVSKARAIIEATKRKPVVIPAHLAYEAVATPGTIHREHAKHVDTRFPAIAVRHKRKLVFIDGNHRVFNRLCRLLPVKAFILTAREKRAILNRK